MLTRTLLMHTHIHMYAHVTSGAGNSSSSSSAGCEGGEGDREDGGGEGGREDGGVDEGEGGREATCDNHRFICTGKQLSSLTGF